MVSVAATSASRNSEVHEPSPRRRPSPSPRAHFVAAVRGCCFSRSSWVLFSGDAPEASHEDPEASKRERRLEDVGQAVPQSRLQVRMCVLPRVNAAFDCCLALYLFLSHSLSPSWPDDPALLLWLASWWLLTRQACARGQTRRATLVGSRSLSATRRVMRLTRSSRASRLPT